MTSGSDGARALLMAVVLGLAFDAEGVTAGGPDWVDPTRPPSGSGPGGGPGASGSEEPAGAGLDLDSILVGEGRRVAVIDGRPYRVGDTVGSLTVTNIYRDRVVLKGKGGTRILRLTMSSGMKKAPSP
ncbi:hypothetical protein [Thiohalorhabdus sp.]|uniref:hypothetical protein n=1 Tax=Thiohalorhabdus sp. TaxID=3094134 RepID=UPI002FC32F33